MIMKDTNGNIVYLSLFFFYFCRKSVLLYWKCDHYSDPSYPMDKSV